eukprot:1026845-Alexandrium_andersonii.AAC.1
MLLQDDRCYFMSSTTGFVLVLVLCILHFACPAAHGKVPGRDDMVRFFDWLTVLIPSVRCSIAVEQPQALPATLRQAQ